MSAKREIRNPFSRRRQSPGTTGKTILIVTEGARTESDYFIGLRNRLKLGSVDIEIMKATGTDALSVVDYAIEMRDKRKDEARRGCTVPYDSAWAVFDTDRADINPKLNDALQKAKSNKIKVALSNPCFEFWLLLHDEFTTRPFECCDKVIRWIKERYMPDYEKSKISTDRLIPKIPTAVQNTEQCRRNHISAGTEGNPSTDVDLLVREMNDATRHHFRLVLTTQARQA